MSGRSTTRGERHQTEGLRRRARAAAVVGLCLTTLAIGCSGDDEPLVTPLPTVVEAVTPARGPTSGGTLVRIEGNYFPREVEVFFGANKADRVEFLSSSELIAVAPIGASVGAVGVQVRNANPAVGNQIAVVETEFEYYDPSTADDPRPSEVDIKTRRGPTEGGTFTLISGDGLQEGVTVFFGFHTAQVVEQEGGGVVIKTPAVADEQSVEVTIQNPDGQFARINDGFAFYVLEEDPERPALAQVEPPLGSLEGGTAVTLSGEDLPAASDLPLVLFGAVAITGLIDGAEGDLGAPTPSHALGSVSVTITTADGLSTRIDPGFTYVDRVATPQERLRVLAIVPDRGLLAGGEEVKVVGLGFVDGARVSIAGQDIGAAFVDENTLTGAAPGADEVGAVDVVVTLPEGASFTLKESYLYEEQDVLVPREEVLLLAAIPGGGPVEGGTQVKLRGVGFTEEASVLFGEDEVESRFVDENTLIVNAPEVDSPRQVDITVRLSDALSSTLEEAFTYFEPTGNEDRLLLLAAIPDRGPVTGGTQVTLRGLGFTPGAVASFGIEDADTRFVDSHTLVATAPPREQVGLADITVRLPDTSTSTLRGAFVYEDSDVVPVSVDLLSPSFGPVGVSTLTIISGAGFDPNTEVDFEGEPAEEVEFLDANTLAVLTPAHEVIEMVDVEVTNASLSTATLSDAFAFADPLVISSPPAISRVEPSRGPTEGGSRLLIRGIGFEEGARVRFGGVFADEVEVLGATRISVVTPAHGAGAVTLSVINPSGVATHLSTGFLYYLLDELTPRPAINAIQPDTGLTVGGTPVILDGQNLAGAALVFVEGRPSPELVVVDASRVTFQTPPVGAPGRADVTITRTDGLSATLEDAFNYRLESPEVSALIPARGPEAGGTIARVEGANFVEGVEVFFGGRAAQVLEVVDEATLTVQTPPGPAGEVDVTVQNPDGQSDTLEGGFTYGGNVGEDPAIEAIEPAQGPVGGGTRLVLRGAHFDEDMAVRFGNNPAQSVTFVSPQLATAVTPPGVEGSVDVVVTGGNGGTALAADAFTYLAPEDFEDPAPELAGLSPTRGSIFGGTRVSLAGANLFSGVQVFIGGRPVEQSQRSSNSLLTATTPSGTPGFANVDVTNTDGQSASLPRAFEYLEGIGGNDDPEIQALIPNRGPVAGGTRTLMTGLNFRPGVQILISGRSATSVQLIDAQNVTFLVPTGSLGPANVTVINTDGRTDTLNRGFIYLDPTDLGPGPDLSGVLPSSGSSAGGQEVLLTGARFDDTTRVFFGGRPAQVGLVLGQTLLRVLTPATPPSVVDVEVVDGDGQTARLVRAFTFTNQSDLPPPSLSRLVPNRGTTLGGTVASVIGSGFTPQTEIFIANRLSEVIFVADTHLQVVTPAGAAGPVDVTAVNFDGQTATLREGFTYLDGQEGQLPPQVLGVTPDEGREDGGEEIVISGRRFVATPAVLVGGRPATQVRFISEGLLRATTPAGRTGAQDVIVTNPSGLSDILRDAYSYVAGPTILDVAPAVGPTTGDTRVSISGQNFQQGAIVLFGDQAAVEVEVLGPSVIEAVTPAAVAAVVDVTLINPDEQRDVAAGAFTFVPSPEIEAVRPNRGPSFGGSYIVVRGDSFRPGARVFFGDEESLDVVFVDERTLTAQLPVGDPGAVDVSVINPAGQQDTLSEAFTYVSVGELGDPPDLTQVIPGQGPTSGDTTALAEGDNLDSGVVLLIGRAPASRVFVYDEGARASFATPASPLTGAVDVHAINSDGQMATLTDGFRYTDPDDLGAPPQLARVEPDEGSSRGGEPLALSGTGFAPGALALIGGRRASNVRVPSPDLIQLDTPPGSPGAADLVVTNLDGQSTILRGAYLYVPPPQIDAITPARGPATAATRVTITGNHFVEGATATVGGRDIEELVVRDAGTILATIPPADDPREGGEDIVVINPDGQSDTLEQGFTYTPPPEIASIDPEEGPAQGGEVVQVHGASFQPGAIARVGDERAVHVEFITDRQLALTTPPGAAGVAAITVINPDGQSDTLPGAYTYVPAPRVDRINPTSGSLEGGGSMDVSGNFFQPGAQVLIGANAAGDITFVSAQVLRVTIPAGAAGPAAVTVINPDTQRGVLPAAYTYVPPRPGPSIVGVTPNFGDEVGGTNVTILGNFFQFGAQVFFGGAEALEVEVLSATFIRARTPGHAPGLVDVTVQNPDEEFANLEDAFSYVARGQLPPIAVTQVVPNTGSLNGNTRVQVVGAGFRFGAQVSFDGVPCTDIRYVGPTIITCTTGAHLAGEVDVSVTNPGGDFATLTEGYTYGNALALALDGWRLPPESLDKRGGLPLDVDNDQDTDLFVFDDNEGFAYMYVNDGGGNFLRRDLGRFRESDCNCCSRCRINVAASGDIDNDGDLDILVGMEDRQMGLYLNQGDGTFERHYICPNNNCGDRRWSNLGGIALVDLDNDGDLDIVVADNDGPNSIALSQGPEVFEANRGPWVFSDGALPETNEKSSALSIGDVDRDGDIDLLIGNRDEEQNRLYLNQGDATFTDATGTHFVVSGGNTQDVKLLDTDGDLDLDALIFNHGQQDRVIINDGEGRYTDQTLGRMPTDLTSLTRSVTVADIDNDGDFDLLTQREDGLASRVLLNLGTNSGIFEDRSEVRFDGLWNQAARALVTADWDDDGFEDIIVIHNANQNLLWMNNGEGDFTDETYEFLPVKLDDSTSLDLGDIDGDGDLDMVVANFVGQEFLYLNDGSGHFFDVTEARLPETTDKSAWDIKFADINGDGDLDIFVGNNLDEQRRCCSNAQNFLFVNDGAGFFTDVSQAVLPENTYQTFGQTFADLDGDGDLEYLVANIDGCNEFALYRNLGDGFNNDAAILSNVNSLLPQFSSCMGGIARFVAEDFNGDGFIDIFAGFNSGQNRLWLNNLPVEFSFSDVTGTHIPGISDRTQDVVFGDFDGDRDVDLLLANFDQRPRLHLNQGDGTFSDVTATNLPDMTRRNRAADKADLDLDGDIDFFLVNDEGRQNTVFLNVGNNFYDLLDEQVPWDNDRSRDVVIGDIDSDGDDDVIVVGNGMNRIYFNQQF